VFVKKVFFDVEPERAAENGAMHLVVLESSYEEGHDIVQNWVRLVLEGPV
jgi:hypothetical protein